MTTHVPPGNFWVFRKHDGCVNMSTIVDPDEMYGDPIDADAPDQTTGSWEYLTHEQWDETARDCLLLKCDHRTTTDEPMAVVTAKEFADMAAVIKTAFEAFSAHVVTVWEAVVPVVTGIMETFHTSRVGSPHREVCASTFERPGALCFCRCKRCWDTSAETLRCVCVACSCHPVGMADGVGE